MGPQVGAPYIFWHDWSEAATKWAYHNLTSSSPPRDHSESKPQYSARHPDDLWSGHTWPNSCIQPKAFALMFAASQSIINCPVHACKLLNILVGWNAIGTPHSSAPTRGYPGSGASHQLLRSPPHALHLDYALRQRSIYCRQTGKENDNTYHNPRTIKML